MLVHRRVTPRAELFKAGLRLGFVRNLNSDMIQFNSFCRQVDDWMLLIITEKIIRENAFDQKKKDTRVKFNPGLSSNRPSSNWA